MPSQLPSPVLPIRLTRLLIASYVVWLVSGCASLPSNSTVLGQQNIEYALAGHGTPTVIFENGLGGSLDWWAEVFPEVAQHTRALAYNRPDYGDSTPVTTPRDGQHIVDELRAFLASQHVSPPYVLVGHSLGGLYMQWFARRYPDEVSGLVLVDSTHPLQLRGAGAPENWPFWVHWLIKLTTPAAGQLELAALDDTGQQVLALPGLADKPVIVLSAAQALQDHSPLADDGNAKRRDFARLYPGSEQIWVDSDHAIPLQQPAAVIAAIVKLLPPASPSQ